MAREASSAAGQCRAAGARQGAMALLVWGGGDQQWCLQAGAERPSCGSSGCWRADGVDAVLRERGSGGLG
jgi:hypothetical protein